MKHTYLFDSLRWVPDGTYYDADGNAYALTGAVEINHTQDVWTLEGYMEVAFAEPVRFTNAYAISATGDASTLAWQSFNPALGVLRGTFEVVDGYIVSMYTSESGEYSGTETLIQIDARTYDNVGVSFRNGKKMSSWAVRLRGSEMR